MDNSQIEEIAMMIVANAGGARSQAILAIDEAREGNFDKADEMIKEAHDYLREAGAEHFKALQMDIKGDLNINLLLMHAEDQYISIDSVVLMSEKMIRMYKDFADCKK